MSSRRPDNLWITVGWNETLNANVFGIRGMGRLYDHVWDELNEVKSVRTAWSDFPWSYIYFFDEDDEKKFRADWAEGMLASPEAPPKNWHQPNDRDDVKWCNETRVFVPIPRERTLGDDLHDILQAEIQQEIDNEIMNNLLNLIGDDALRKTNP